MVLTGGFATNMHSLVASLSRSAFPWLLCLITGVFAPYCEANDLLVFCVENKDVRPWILREGKGLNIELLDRVAQQLRMTFVYNRAPWKRCFDALKRGEVDGVVGVSFKPERAQYGVFPGGNSPKASKRLNLDRYILVRPKGSPLNWDGKNISGLNGLIGTQLGYSVTDLLSGQGVSVDEGAPGATELLRKLLAGHVAAVAMLEGEAKALLAVPPFDKKSLEILPVPLAEKPYYLQLSHHLHTNRPKLANSLWDSIEHVRESREYQQLESRLSQVLTNPRR